MKSWILVVAGGLICAAGVMVAVSVTSLGRLELARLVSRRLRGSTGTSRMLALQPRVLDGAGALASAGVLLVGIGLSASLSGLHPLVIVVAVFFLAVPVTLGLAYALPRAVGLRWPETIARQCAERVSVFARLFGMLLPKREANSSAALSAALKNGGADGLFEADEIHVISGVLSFNERPVREVMTPRTDIVSVSEGASVNRVGRVFADSGFSRLPVYRDSPDNVIGMIYAFDLLKVNPGGELPLRPVVETPASKPCADLLFEMQNERRHLAVVLDEFGGTAGIVTLGDLLAALVTELFGTVEQATQRNNGRSEPVEFDASTPSAEIAEHFGIELPGSAETIGGLLVRAAGRIPRNGERFEFAGLEFDVIDASRTNVRRVIVRHGPVRTEHVTPGGHSVA